MWHAAPRTALQMRVPCSAVGMQGKGGETMTMGWVCDAGADAECNPKRNVAIACYSIIIRSYDHMSHIPILPINV